MVESHTPVGHAEAIEVRLIRASRIDIDEVRHTGGTTLERLEPGVDDGAQPFVGEVDRRLRALSIVVAEETDAPVVTRGARLANILQDQLLRQSMLTELLGDMEERLRKRIHIHTSMVVEVLIARSRLELYARPLVAHQVAEGSGMTLIGLGGISYQRQSLLSRRVIGAIGEASLAHVVPREAQSHLQLGRRAILQLHEAPQHTETILVGSASLIVEVASAGRP